MRSGTLERAPDDRLRIASPLAPPHLPDHGHGRSLLLLVALACGSALAGLALSGTSPLLALSLAAGSLLIVLALGAPRVVVLFTLCALPFLGLLRRATGSYLDTADPMLFIAPAVAMVCVLAGRLHPGRAVSTRLGKLVLLFIAIGVVGAANPRQGGITVGVIGAGLFVGPMVWFFVGQRFGDAELMRRLQKGLAVIAVLVVLYGMKQQFFGFFGFEQRWVDSRLGGYSALSLSGHIRSFSTFASSAEYSYFLLLGAVLFAMKLGRGRRLLFGLPVLLFALSCFYAGSRGIFVSCCTAVLLVATVKRTKRLGRSIVLCVVLSLAGLSLLRFVPLSSGDSLASASRNRTIEGLTRPFDSGVSTLGIHIDTFTSGIKRGLENPLGVGAGVTNRAGALFGPTSESSEHDLPNVLIAYGWLGGVLLVFLVSRVYGLGRRAAEKGDAELLGPVIFALVLFGSWFVGGLYAISAILWFLLGAVDGRLAPAPEPAEAIAEDPVPGLQPSARL